MPGVLEVYTATIGMLLQEALGRSVRASSSGQPTPASIQPAVSNDCWLAGGIRVLQSVTAGGLGSACVELENGNEAGCRDQRLIIGPLGKRHPLLNSRRDAEPLPAALTRFRGELLKVVLHGLLHFAPSLEQPAARPLLKIGQKDSRLNAAQVDVGRFPTHGMQQA